MIFHSFLYVYRRVSQTSPHIPKPRGSARDLLEKAMLSGEEAASISQKMRKQQEKLKIEVLETLICNTFYFERFRYWFSMPTAI